MQFAYTVRQVPRGSRPDAVVNDKVYLIKKVSTLRATYQIRLLAFEAQRQNKKLILKVPKGCRFQRSLTDLIERVPAIIKREVL